MRRQTPDLNADQGADSQPRAARRVLYIEDSLVGLAVVESLLTRRPAIEIRTAERGVQGLEMARAEHLDLILLDLHLPDLAGDAVLQQLQMDPATRDIPVVILSSDSSPQLIEHMLAAGARAYLIKPFEAQQFLSMLDEVLSR